MDTRSTHDLKHLKATFARSRRIGSCELPCINMRLVHHYKWVLFEDATKSLEWWLCRRISCTSMRLNVRLMRAHVWPCVQSYIYVRIWKIIESGIFIFCIILIHTQKGKGQMAFILRKGKGQLALITWKHFALDVYIFTLYYYKWKQ